MSSVKQNNIPLIIGHRGSSREAPENTLESFRLAWDQGADGIEADFRLTVDDQIVCMHDETTSRTTGVNLSIGSSTLKELRRLNAGHWKGAAWSGAIIPTLEEVLTAVPFGSWFFIELKSDSEIIVPLQKVLIKSGLSPERVRLLSFSIELIANIKQQLPDWHACWLCDYRHISRGNLWRPSRADVLETLHRSRADGLASSNRAFLDKNIVDALKDLGKEIHVWTVDRFSDAERLRELGVDSIMTNRPGWLRHRLLETQAP